MTPKTTIHPTANALNQTKSSGVQRGVVMPVALTLLTIFSAGTAQAVDYTWDPTSSDSATTEGAGNWDTTTTNWTTDVGATNEVGGTGSDPFNEDLIFGGGTLGTAGTVTLTETGNDYGSIEFLATNAGTYTIDLNGNEVELKRSGNTFLIGEDATITDIAGGGTLTLNGSRQFNFTDSSKTLSISAVIAGGGGTYSVGTGGTLDLSGVNTFTSALTLSNQSQLVISGAGQLGSGSYAGNITMNQGTDFTYASSAIQTLSGIISDDGTANGNNDVNMTGSGTLTLSGANTYTGVTNINAGTLVADVADVAATSGALGNGGNISFTGGTLQYGTGITQDYSARILNSTSAISVDTNGEDVTWGTALVGSNTGGLTKDGVGTLVIDAKGANTGVATVNGGTLEISATVTGNNLSYTSYQINNGSTLFFNETTASNIVLGLGSGDITFGSSVTGGTLQLFGNTIFRNQTITTTGGAKNFITGDRFNLQNTRNITFDTAVGTDVDGIDLEVSATISSGDIIKDGVGTVSITNSANNLGVVSGTPNTVTINAGTLEVGGAGRLQSGSYAGAITNAGIFKYNSTIDQTLSGVISGAGALTKDNTSTLTLSALNTYTGATTISDGTLEIGSAGKLGNGSYAGTIANDGILNYNSSATQTLNGIISGTGALTKDNTSTLTLTGANTYSGATNINAGILRADVADVAATSGALGNGGDITFTGGTLQYTANSAGSDYSTRIKSSTSAMTFDTNGQNVTFATKFANTNTGGLTKLGAGELSVVLDSSSYTGLTKVDGGTLVLGNNTVNNTNTSSSGFEINNGSTLQFERGAQGILIGGKTFTFDSNGGGALEVNGSALLWRDNTIVTSGGLQNTFSGTAGVNVQNNLNNAVTQARFMTFDVADGSDEVDLLVSTNVANAKLIKNGAGTVALTSSANELTLATQTVTINAGTLEIGGAGRLNVGNYSQAITNDGTFKYNSSADQTLSGVISGSGALTQSGAGTLTLSGANTYTGATTVSAGILLINNTTGSGTGTGAVTVASGASLGGSGTISGATTIQSGGFLAPGNSPGILTFSDDLTLASGSFTNMEITGSTRGTDYDGIDVDGALTYGGGLTLTSNTLIGVGEYNLFDFTSESGDFSSITLSGTAYSNNTFTQDGDVWDAIVDNQTYTYSQVTGNLVVATAAVPEPETFALLGGLLALTYVLGRRRHR